MCSQQTSKCNQGFLKWQQQCAIGSPTKIQSARTPLHCTASQNNFTESKQYFTES